MNNLRQIRRSRNINQSIIADILKLTRPMISRIENGHQKLDEEQIKIICDYFECDPCELIGYKKKTA